VQHVVDHLATIARVTYTDANAEKLAAAEMIDDVAQTVVPTVSSTLLDTVGAGRQVEFVVNHQDFLRRDLVVTRQPCHGLAAAVHKGLRLEQKNVTGTRFYPAFVGVETLLEAEAGAQVRGNFVDQPETGVMARINVIGPGIPEADYHTKIRG
jgi:hypothetical protein